jgi:Outer membrane protein beta-barrel domain
MKKYFCCFVFFLFLCSFSSQAQVRFGVQAGAGFSKLNSPYLTFSNGLCYSGGLMAVLPIKNKNSIVSGLQYEHLETKIPNVVLLDNLGSFEEGDGEMVIPYNYLKIPILARFGIGAEKSPKLYVEGGGFVSYLLNVKVSGINKNTRATVEYSENLSLYNKIVAGLTAGVGYQLTNNIDIGGRFNYNLIPVAPEAAKFVNTQLLLSYLF